MRFSKLLVFIFGFIFLFKFVLVAQKHSSDDFDDLLSTALIRQSIDFALSRNQSDNVASSKCNFDTNAIINNTNLPKLVKILENSHLKVYDRVNEIPKFIFDYLNCISSEDFTIANPGEDWNSGCKIIIGRPDLQLVKFWIGNNVALITYNKGGFGGSSHIVILQIKKNYIVDLWFGVANYIDKNMKIFFPDVSNLKEIINCLKNQRYKTKDKELIRLYF